MKAVVTSYEYAKMYNGKFIVRIEDTDPNPDKVKKENIDFIKKDFKAMGIKWDKFYLSSSRFDKQYKLAEKLIKEDKAYVCTCPPIMDLKDKHASASKKECSCRGNSTKENLDLWKQMLAKKIQPSGAVVRLKTDINDPNPALRDPVIMRIKDGKNPTTGKEHWVYPSYNFNAAVEDHDEGVTHILRGTEHVFNTIVQHNVCEALGWSDYNPVAINFCFLYMPDEKVHKRFIRDAIAAGKFTGWDDPRLGQYGLVRALIRRGITPEAIKNMIIEMGVTPQTVHFKWDKLYTENRKIIDKKSKRYFFVSDPIETKLDKLTAKSVKAPSYPGKKIFRKIPTSKKIFVDKLDFIANREKEVRLMHFCNVYLDHSSKVTDKALKDVPKIHWVGDKNVKVKLIMPDGTEVNGLAEPDVKKAKVNDMVQFERVGFARCDGKNVFYFAHK
jgi:glutamyl-tRNA synthetase